MKDIKSWRDAVEQGNAIKVSPNLGKTKSLIISSEAHLILLEIIK